MEPAIAVEWRPPLLVTRQRHALRYHEFEEVVADPLARIELVALDRVQAQQELLVGLQSPLLCVRRDRRQAIVECVVAIRARRERVRAPHELALVSE